MCRERRPAKGWGQLAGKGKIEVEGREEDEWRGRRRTGQAKGEDPKSVVMHS